MITKSDLQSVINKYYLNGLIEAVKWEIKDKKLKIKFMAPTSDMLGALNLSDFSLEDISFAIYETTKLNKLISITQGDLLLSVSKTNKVATKLNISDTQFNVNFALADTMMVKKVADITEPEQYEIEIELEQEQVAALIKSKNALGDDNNVLLENTINEVGEPSVLFTFGESNEYSNKVSYSIPAKCNSQIKLAFPSNILKEILIANKDMSKGKILINKGGLMKLSFSNEKNLTSEYFLVCKSEG